MKKRYDPSNITISKESSIFRKIAQNIAFWDPKVMTWYLNYLEGEVFRTCVAFTVGFVPLEGKSDNFKHINTNFFFKKSIILFMELSMVPHSLFTLSSYLLFNYQTQVIYYNQNACLVYKNEDSTNKCLFLQSNLIPQNRLFLPHSETDCCTFPI